MSENKTAENTKNQQSDNILEVSHLKKYFPIKVECSVNRLEL